MSRKSLLPKPQRNSSIRNSNNNQKVWWSGNIQCSEPDDPDIFISEMRHKISEMFDDLAVKWVFQAERGDDTNRLHFDFCLKLKKKLRKTALIKLFKNNVGDEYEAFLKTCDKGRLDYSHKVKTRVAGPWANFRLPRELVKVQYDELRPWQKKLADQFEDFCPRFDRTINWYVDEVGNFGKTVMTKFFVDNRHVLVTNGKATDTYNQLFKFIETHGDGPDLVIFDVPRCNAEYVSYQAIEKLKDGVVYSGKYEGGMCRFNTPHVIVFANTYPNSEQLSADRWNIVVLSTLDDDMLQLN